MLNSIGYNNILLYKNGKEAYDNIINIEKIFVNIHGFTYAYNGRYTCTSKLRNHGITTPIIALTANSMLGVKEKCINIGMNDILINQYKY